VNIRLSIVNKNKNKCDLRYELMSSVQSLIDP